MKKTKKLPLEELQMLFSQALDIINKAVEESKKIEKEIKVWDLRQMNTVLILVEDAKKHLEDGGAILDDEGNSISGIELDAVDENEKLILLPRAVGG